MDRRIVTSRCSYVSVPAVQSRSRCGLGSRGPYKLPGLGVPLAAEALKNLGFAVAKPDRHVMRAVGSFGLVRFNRWESGPRGKPVSQSKEKFLEVMVAVERIAKAAERSVVVVDNAIWLLCAKDEMHPHQFGACGDRP